MKKIFLGVMAAAALMFTTSCNSTEKEPDTVVIEKEAPASAPVEEENNTMKIDANVDENGKVSGGISTDIDLDDN